MDRETASGLGGQHPQGRDLSAEAKTHELTVAEVEDWREKFLLGAENALRARPKDEEAGVAQATFYGLQMPREASEVDLLLCDLIDEEYTRRPFYDSRRMVVYLARQGYAVNRKRVQRLMRSAGMAPGPSTSVTHPGHQVSPYLLRDIEVRPNQVWSTDITYIRLARGFVYLVAIIDWDSRRVLAWRISTSPDTSFGVDFLEDTLSLVGKPDIFNSDQGAQFTSAVFTDVLKRTGIAISMDGVDAPWTISSSNGWSAASSTRRCF